MDYINNEKVICYKKEFPSASENIYFLNKFF